MQPTQYPYRVFVSYAKEDRRHAEKIVSRLRDLDLQPLWDQDNRGGWPFVEVTKTQIAHSHLFLPLLTPRSVRSTWVNHEIGFAFGRSVPVLPLSLGPPPGGMAGALHADVADQVDDLLPKLTRERLAGLVEGGPTVEMYEVAAHPDDRTAAIVRHCRELTSLGLPRPQRLRHRAAFGSFSLPADPDDPSWDDRYDGEPWRAANTPRKEALSEERRLLERHATQFGCDLVLYPCLPNLTPKAITARIGTIRSFLDTMQGASADVRVLFDRSALGSNLLIVGDWFGAESVTPRADGFLQTTLTSHAPTVLDRIRRFEQRFERQGTWMSAGAASAWLERNLDALLGGEAAAPG